MIRATIVLSVLSMFALLAGCGESEHDRLLDAQARAAANGSVARSDVVRLTQGEREPGRIIYDRPIDLSYATLRKTRPDLDSAHASPAMRGGAEAARRRQ